MQQGRYDYIKRLTPKGILPTEAKISSEEQRIEAARLIQNVYRNYRAKR